MTPRPLPLVPSQATPPGGGPPVGLGLHVDHGDACITCGDVAVALVVVDVDGTDARCRDEASGAEEVVAVDLVGPVAPGDHVLVHARVAIEVIE